MSRHRNVRSMNFTEEYDEYYDTYGQSVEDDYCISPNTERQFMYNRGDDSRNMSLYINDDDEMKEFPQEENDDDLNTSLNGIQSNMMDDMERAKMLSCVEEMQNVVGDTIPESTLREAARIHAYNAEAALDAVLNSHTFGAAKNVQKNRIEKISGNSSNTQKLEPIDGEVAKISENIERIELLDKSRSDPNLLVVKSAILEENTKTKPGGSVPMSPVSSRNSSRISSPTQEKTTSESRASTKVTQSKSLIPEVALSEYNKSRASAKPLINLVVIGHVDAGKSTLMGHLLYLLGFVSKKAIHRYETDSKKAGKASFAFAWVLDETQEERTRGITMDVAHSRFETANRNVTLLDAPGHKDFIPNMITGAAQADVALLVVDATKGEFETGFESGGQTREHTLLVRSLGVSQLAVVINKLDNVDWSNERYDEIVKKLSAFLKQAGFKEQDVCYIPCSGLTGENLIERSKNEDLISWYKGPCLVEVIDAFKPPDRPISKPFRMCINDIFKGVTAGTCIGGRVEAGAVQVGQKLVVLPSGETCSVKAINIDDASVSTAFVGDHISLTIVGCDPNNIAVGSVTCDVGNPAPVTSRFEARVVLFSNIEVPLTKGLPVVLHFQSLNEQAVIKKLISQLHKSTGQVIKNKPRCLVKNSNGIIEIEVNRPICVELYKDYKDLGRFMIRSGGTTFAAGVVTKIL